MTLTKALNILRHHQLWRLGDEITQLEPKIITEAIDTILKKHSTQMTDTILESLLTKFRKRSEVGQRKYNTTLDRKDLTYEQWLNHLQEELMDACLYVEKIKVIVQINDEYFKEHLEKAWDDGHDWQSKYKDFEDYYKQNYNNDKQTTL